jgi:pimeloyl-ACP methyl ester carboxylesterase
LAFSNAHSTTALARAVLAPHKRLYIFGDSGHGMIWQETDKFHDVMINTVLPETYQP